MIAPVVSSGSMTAAMRIGPDYGSVLGAYQLAGDRPLAAFFIVAVIPGSSSSRMAPSRSAVAEVASSSEIRLEYLPHTFTDGKKWPLCIPGGESNGRYASFYDAGTEEFLIASGIGFGKTV